MDSNFTVYICFDVSIFFDWWPYRYWIVRHVGRAPIAINMQSTSLRTSCIYMPLCDSLHLLILGWLSVSNSQPSCELEKMADWLRQMDRSLSANCWITYADCQAVSQLSQLGNLYRPYGVLFRIFGSTSLHTNINISRLKFSPNLPNTVSKYS